MARVIEAKDVILVFLAIVIVWNAALYIGNRKEMERTGRMRRLALSAFIMYMFIVMAFTLLPILVPPMFTEELQYNLNIGELFSVLTDRASLINIAGNVIFFMPVSILGFLADMKCFRSVKFAAVTSLLISVIIEFLQGVETYFGFADFPAVVDINDLITNTIGGVIGYILIDTYCRDRKP